MTSIPASRRALAMTLAPRSCPSRPGLAIKTRIGRVLCSIWTCFSGPFGAPSAGQSVSADDRDRIADAQAVARERSRVNAQAPSASAHDRVEHSGRALRSVGVEHRNDAPLAGADDLDEHVTDPGSP